MVQSNYVLYFCGLLFIMLLILIFVIGVVVFCALNEFCKVKLLEFF